VSLASSAGVVARKGPSQGDEISPQERGKISVIAAGSATESPEELRKLILAASSIRDFWLKNPVTKEIRENPQPARLHD
jgi:hypothetical protein